MIAGTHRKATNETSFIHVNWGMHWESRCRWAEWGVKFTHLVREEE